jgi:hypothetical protein
MTANEAMQPFARLIPYVKPFRDAQSSPTSLVLSIRVCIHAIEGRFALVDTLGLPGANHR